MVGSFWDHYESKRMDSTIALTQQLLDLEVVTSWNCTRVHSEAQLRNKFIYQSIRCPDDSGIRVVNPDEMGCLSGMSILTENAIESDDLIEDKSEESPSIKTVPTLVVY
jgi:hypothetical protein